MSYLKTVNIFRNRYWLCTQW